MKKIVILALTVVLALSFAGCGKKDGGNTPDIDSIKPNPEASVSPSSATPNPNVVQNDTTNQKSLNDIVKYFESKGYKLEKAKEKPDYEMFMAKDGIEFTLEKDCEWVKIYEYESVDELKKVREIHTALVDMPQKGVFVLNTRSQIAKEVFQTMD